MLKELEHGKEWDYEDYEDYEDYPALVSMVTKLGAIYMLVKKGTKYFWFNVEDSRFNVEDSRVSTKYFTWEEAVDHMREVGAMIYMYDTMDDVAHMCHWAEARHI